MNTAILAGLDKQTAQKVLQAWEASGASSPDELRKLLVKRSVLSAGTVLVQTVLDAGAGAGPGLVHAVCHNCWRGMPMHTCRRVMGRLLDRQLPGAGR